MVKLNRNYILQVEQSRTRAGSVDVITITPPFTIEFKCDFVNRLSSSSGHIKIRNLSKVHRDAIRKDYGGNGLIDGQSRRVSLNAGYGKSLSNIARGWISQAWSVREGTDFITEIEFLPGGDAIARARTNAQFAPGTSVRSMIGTCLGDMSPYGISVGAIGQYDETIKRRCSLSGNTADIVNQLSGGGFSIQNDLAFVLSDGEYIKAPVSVLNAKSGLINTPVRQLRQVSIEMIFEPRILMNQIINLESSTFDTNTGDNSLSNTATNQYIVTGINHRGMISPVVCGEAITQLTLSIPTDVNLATP